MQRCRFKIVLIIFNNSHVQIKLKLVIGYFIFVVIKRSNYNIGLILVGITYYIQCIFVIMKMVRTQLCHLHS